MTFSWSEENGVSAGSDEVLFTVMLKAEQSVKISEMVELGSWTTRAESYSGEELPFSLLFAFAWWKIRNLETV